MDEIAMVMKVIRGNSWQDLQQLSSTDRDGYITMYRNYLIGFRLVKEELAVKVLCGASWHHPSQKAISVPRSRYNISDRSIYIGFRLVKEKS
jgi:formylglycine-generating enzyme required for sulfatase activity